MPMTFESLPEHLKVPHLRPIQPFPVNKDGKQYVALRDPQMLHPQTMVIPTPALGVLQEFRGLRPLDQIATQVENNLDQLIELAKGLDQLGLLWGPTFEKLEIEALEKVKEAGAFAPNSSLAIGETEKEARENIKAWFDQTEDPELDAVPEGIIAPHLDYERGWPNYAAAYYCVQSMPTPDRVVILGTNHFGIGDGVVFTECGFSSPLGTCPADEQVTKRIISELGNAIVIDQLDFKAEHSIDLHLPWIQYCFGEIPLIAALIPDPIHPMIDDDGERIEAGRFISALSGALKDLGGKTLFVASSDLSHVGPQFGEPRPVDDQRKFDVERHDREMMAKFISGDSEEFLDAMRWNKNPTRWCSIGNMSALLSLVAPETVELIDYRQACDEKGHAMVSSAAMVLC